MSTRPKRGFLFGATPSDSDSPQVLSQASFGRVVEIERRRTERSRRPILLMRIAVANGIGAGLNWDRLLAAILENTRETDRVGWFEEGVAVGAVFTEIQAADVEVAGEAILGKMRALLLNEFGPEGLQGLQLTLDKFPEDWHDGVSGGGSASHADVLKGSQSRRAHRILKRGLDLASSLSAIILFLPLGVAIAIAVKLTSEGPIFFRQTRVGQFGRKFTFLKFRSMYVKNDNSIHQQYVKELILGKPSQQSGQPDGVFKLTKDPRITPLGRFLRRSSLDELPQFLNVLIGDMSLVGPRPPIPYEVACYDIWHRRRLLSVKPGITGLWQVSGRSRTTFDEMVRLDLRYARSWSIWMDLRIMLQTPRAMFGDGAF